MSHHTLWRPPLHPIHPPLHLIYCPPNDTNTLSSWYPSIPYPLAISRQRSIEFVSTFGEGIWCTPHLQHLWCARLQPWWPYSTLPRLHDDRRSSLYAWQRPVPVGAPSNSAQTRLVHDIWCRGRSGFIGRGWPLLWFCQQCLYCQLIPTHTIQTAITTIEWRGRTLFSDHYRRGIGMTTIIWGYQTSGIRACGMALWDTLQHLLMDIMSRIFDRYIQYNNQLDLGTTGMVNSTQTWGRAINFASRMIMNWWEYDEWFLIISMYIIKTNRM